MLLTSVRPGFYPRSEGRKGDTFCREGGYTESVRSSVNHFKPFSKILAWLLFPPLWLAYSLQRHPQFQQSHVNELDAERATAFPVVPLPGTCLQKSEEKGQGAGASQCVPALHSLPRESTRALSRRGSARPQRRLSGGDSTKSISPSFSLPELLACPLAHSLLLCPGSPKAWAVAAPASFLSALLHPLIARRTRPTAPLSPLQPRRRSAGGTWAVRKEEGWRSRSLFSSAERSEGCDTLPQQDLYLLL